MIGTVNAYKIAINSLLVNIRQQAVRVYPCEFDRALIQKNHVRFALPVIAVAAGNRQAKADGL